MPANHVEFNLVNHYPCWGKSLNSPTSCKDLLIYTAVHSPNKPIGSPHWASVDRYFSLLLALTRGEQMFVHVAPEAAFHNTKESQLLHTIALSFQHHRPLSLNMECAKGSLWTQNLYDAKPAWYWIFWPLGLWEMNFFYSLSSLWCSAIAT